MAGGGWRWQRTGSLAAGGWGRLLRGGAAPTSDGGGDASTERLDTAAGTRRARRPRAQRRRLDGRWPKGHWPDGRRREHGPTGADGGTTTRPDVNAHSGDEDGRWRCRHPRMCRPQPPDANVPGRSHRQPAPATEAETPPGAAQEPTRPRPTRARADPSSRPGADPSEADTRPVPAGP